MNNRPPHRIRRVALAALVLVLLIAAVAAFVLGKQRSSIPTDVLRLMEGTPPQHLSVWTPTAGITNLTLKVPGTLVDFARFDAAQYGTVLRADQTYGIYSFTTKQFLKTDGAPKSGLAVSRDGNTIAFADRIVSTTTATTSVAGWKVVIIDRRVGAPIVLGTGSDPQFFVREGKEYLFFNAPKGVSVADLGDHTVHTTFFTHADDLHAAVVDPAGAYVALKNASGQYEMDVITNPYPEFDIQLKGTLPAGFTSVAFLGQTLYGVRGSSVQSFVAPAFTAGPTYPLPASSAPLYFQP